MTSDNLSKAVLLAAGRGTRLGAITADRPKPMVTIHNKPILEWILTGLHTAGVDQFLLVAGYRAEALKSYFGDGSRWNVHIDYVLQETPNGTGAALALATAWAANDPVIVTYGDILTDPAHYLALRDNYLSAPCTAVIGINPTHDPWAGGAAFREDPAHPGRLTKVWEKPPRGMVVDNWNIAGISAYSAAVWPAVANLKPSARGEFELTDAITTLIEARASTGLEARAQEMRGFWSDIGTPEALAEAERNWKE